MYQTEEGLKKIESLHWKKDHEITETMLNKVSKYKTQSQWFIYICSNSMAHSHWFKNL